MAPKCACALLRSMRQRIRAKLELHELRRSAFAALDVERRAVTRGRPDSAAFPTAVRVVDPAVHGLGVEAHGIGDHKIDHLAVLQRNDRLVLIACGKRNVLAEPQRVVLVDPGVVARLGRSIAGVARQLRSRERIERPAE